MTKKHYNQLRLFDEYFRALGAEPVVVDTSDKEDARKKAIQIAERIKEAAEEIRSEQNG